MSTMQKLADVLQDVVDSNNNSVSRTVDHKPTDITPAIVGDVREVLSNRALSKKKGNIKVWDTVRISKVKSIFAKGYLPNWTEEFSFTVAIIYRKISPLTYKLKDYDGEVTKGSTYCEEIEHVIHECDKYTVEKVLRTEKRGNEKWSLVKWSSYPPSMNCWGRSKDIFTFSDRKRL